MIHIEHFKLSGSVWMSKRCELTIETPPKFECLLCKRTEDKEENMGFTPMAYSVWIGERDDKDYNKLRLGLVCKSCHTVATKFKVKLA